MWIMYNMFQALPPSIEEAATIDGATTLQTFRRIVLPIVRPGMAATAIITFLFGWGQFIFPLVLGSTNSTEPLTVALSSLAGRHVVPYTMINAGGDRRDRHSGGDRLLPEPLDRRRYRRRERQIADATPPDHVVDLTDDLDPRRCDAQITEGWTVIERDAPIATSGCAPSSSWSRPPNDRSRSSGSPTSSAVSAATIRRDTVVLERQGVVARSWGRVGRPGGFVEQPIGERAAQHPAEKRRIAEAAAKLVPDEALVGLTGGTTTLAVARAIAGRRRLTVVTNSLSVGMQLAPRSNIRLILSGGEARTASFELSGPLAVSAIEAFNLDLAILGVDGIDVRAGCTAYDHAEANTNAALVQRAAQDGRGRRRQQARARRLRPDLRRLRRRDDHHRQRRPPTSRSAEFIEAGLAVERV